MLVTVLLQSKREDVVIACIKIKGIIFKQHSIIEKDKSKLA